MYTTDLCIYDCDAKLLPGTITSIIDLRATILLSHQYYSSTYIVHVLRELCTYYMNYVRT